MPRSFSIGQDLERFVDDEVAAGRFRDADAVVRAGLRLLGGLHEGDGNDSTLRRLIEDGEASGLSDEDPELFFDRLEARHTRRPDRP